MSSKVSVPGSVVPADPHSRSGGILGAFDLRGNDGRISHSKMVALTSWLFGLAWDVWFILHGAPYTFLLSWTALTFVAPYGLKGFSLWFNSKAVAAANDGIAEEEKAILARRALTNGDHEPTD